MKTQLEIDALKRNWERDPCWDIEDTEGFEEHWEELLAYRKNKEAEWDTAKIKHHDKLLSLLCPMSFGNPDPDEDYHCVVERCAWWNEANDCCVIRALTLK